MLIHLRNFFTLLVVAVLIRLPHVLSENFVLDSDESVLGICTRLWVEDGIFYWIFPGQKYGLIFPELLAALPAVLLGGITPFTIKVPQLLWFVLGVYFLFLMAKHKTTPVLAWTLAIMLVTCTTWFLWGIRIRGGYVPAFALSNLLIYLAVCKYRSTLLFSLMMGVGLGLLFHLHPLWSLGTAFFALAAMNRDALNPRLALTLIAGICLAWIPPHLAQPDYLFYDPQFFTVAGARVSNNASIYLSYFERNFNGLYLHGRAYAGFWATRPYVLVLALLVVGVWFGAVVQAVKQRARGLFYLAGIGAMATVFVVPFFLVSAAPRYALPLFGFLFPTMLLLLEEAYADKRSRRLAMGFLSTLIALSAVVWSQSGKVTYEDYTRGSITELVQYLKSEEVKSVFTINAGLQWQVMFYANGEIPARNKPIHDRIPALSKKATAGYNADWQHSALVELAWEYDEDVLGPPTWSNGSFAVLLAPHYDLMNGLGFQGLQSKRKSITD
ncbi:MAG: hypothetical protein RLP15_12575 [Cryomorphaceae bacterium]